MNRQRVINIIREPLQMQHEKDLPLIKELIEEFPYFSTPYVLLTRLLSEQKSIYLDKYLKLSASYIGDREVLYNLIHAAPKQETASITEENQAVQNLNTENEKPVITEVALEPAQSISTNTYIYKQEIAEPAAVINDTKEQELPEEVQAQPTVSTNDEIVAHPEQEIKEEFEVEAPAQAAYIESEKNASVTVDVSQDEIIESNPIPKEEIPVAEAEEETIEKAEETPISETENLSVQEEIPTQENLTEVSLQEENIAEEPETVIAPTENVTEKQEQQELKKPERKKIDLDLPPLAAYDYFAFQEKKIKKPEETETPVITEPIETKAENTSLEPIISNSTETSATQKPSGNISFGAWLAAIGQNKTPQTAIQAAIGTAPIKTEVTHQQPIKPERKAKREDVEDIISKFIQTEPRIKPKPAKFFTPQDVAERSAEPDHTLVTETLANIYLKQGLTEKAVEIFNQLILKYPQKSDYFAVKIQEINTKAV